jgi:riboflavin transporter FmnP
MENVVKRNTSNAGFTAKKLAFIGLFGAVASVLMFLEFPLPFAPGFYKLDLSEVPVLIGAFALGPISGLFIELIKILVHLVIKGTQTAGVGELANLVIGCSLVLPAALIYRAGKTRKRAVIGMITGTLVMTVVGCFMNAFVLLPAYAAAFGMPMETLVGMGTAVNKAVHDVLTFAVLCVAPFNLLKGIVVSVVTFLLYKHISTLIKSV